MRPAALEGWHRYVAEPTAEQLAVLLHPQVVFESPVLHTPQVGRERVARYLECAVHVLGGPQFRYVGEWHGERGSVLEFVAEREGVRINGVDLLEFSADGTQITRFKVMLRPARAIELVQRRMAEALGAA